MTTTAAPRKSLLETLGFERQRDVIHVQIARGPFMVEDVNVSGLEVWRPESVGVEEIEPLAGRLRVDHRREAATLYFPAEAEGYVERHDARYPLDELLAEGHVAQQGPGMLRLTVAHDDEVRLEVAGCVVKVGRESIELPGTRAIALGALRDHLGAMVALSVAVHLVFLGLAFMIPVQSFALNLDSHKLTDRFAEVAAVKPVEPEIEALAAGQDEEATDEDETVEDGQQQPTTTATRPSPARTWKPRPTARPQQREAASVGALDVLSQQRAALTVGNLDQATERLGAGNMGGHDKGAPGGDLGGPLGGVTLSQRFGVPGGGDRFLVGERGVATVDRQRHRRVGEDLIDEKKPEVEVRAQVRPGPVVAIGNLDRGIIQGRIQSQMARFRYCYERQLQGNPSLSGRIVVSFTIDHTGRVVAAHQATSSMNNAAVEGCILQSVRAIRFPSFAEGTVVVNYPLTFARRDQ